MEAEEAKVDRRQGGEPNYTLYSVCTKYVLLLLVQVVGSMLTLGSLEHKGFLYRGCLFLVFLTSSRLRSLHRRRMLWRSVSKG